MPVRNLPQQGSTEPGDSPGASGVPWLWRLVILSAVLSAVVGLGFLAWIISLNLTGARSGSEIIWIPMVSLPLAFILMVVILLGAVARRRRL
ncbi:hypothetical protein ODZ83_04755 [Acaricomes phytoseiuli]|uniref:hypothetical protein n=1 Tax=Acaricomes phytoseiuli TaxID=291968 RepID=UPI00035E1E1F|nr:hypothetical protein [Acaricomes phytoseiuli]MCW1249500.1 hypothetical protein [Acaricomes phytoseiuli]